MRPEFDLRLGAWMEAQFAETLYLSTITCAELRLGAAILPQCRKKQRLTTIVGQVLALFQPRILPFDEAAAKTYAELIAAARARGHAIGILDGQIASIAKTHGFAVATKDTMPFEAAGLTVISPWKTATG